MLNRNIVTKQYSLFFPTLKNTLNRSTFKTICICSCVYYS